MAALDLSVGALILPAFGWFAGVVLLWSSGLWTTRDKLIGTVVVPGGLAPAVLFACVAGSSSGGVCVDGGCSGGGSSAMDIVGPIVLAVLVLGPWRRRSTSRCGSEHPGTQTRR